MALVLKAGMKHGPTSFPWVWLDLATGPSTPGEESEGGRQPTASATIGTCTPEQGWILKLLLPPTQGQGLCP